MVILCKQYYADRDANHAGAYGYEKSFGLLDSIDSWSRGVADAGRLRFPVNHVPAAAAEFAQQFTVLFIIVFVQFFKFQQQFKLKLKLQFKFERQSQSSGQPGYVDFNTIGAKPWIAR